MPLGLTLFFASPRRAHCLAEWIRSLMLADQGCTYVSWVSIGDFKGEGGSKEFNPNRRKSLQRERGAFFGAL